MYVFLVKDKLRTKIYKIFKKMLIIYGKRLPQTVVTSFANLYYYGLFYFVSARQSISLSCVMFMFATEEIKMDSMPSGR